LKQAGKGHNPRVKEPDIMYAFKINLRTEKYNLDLSNISAHTFKIIEIIEEEKQNVEKKQKKKMEKMMQDAG